MTTANDTKTRAQLDAEIADLQEALSIAVQTASELLRLDMTTLRPPALRIQREIEEIQDDIVEIEGRQE